MIAKLRVPLLVALTVALMAVTSLVMLGIAIPTLFLARRLYAEVMAAWLGRAILRLWGLRLAVQRGAGWPARQVVYVSNHTSTIDVFALIALGLPRTRYFMSGFLRKFIPLGIIGYLIRIFWTVPQQFPARRRRIFRRADRILRRTGDSVYLSPEGQRVTGGGIGHFNKGAFHLATSLRAPIVPLFFHIPTAIDPGRGYDARQGTVEVFVLPAIDTTGWRLEDVERNRENVRALYVATRARLTTRPEPRATERSADPFEVATTGAPS